MNSFCSTLYYNIQEELENSILTTLKRFKEDGFIEY